jgi:hypothetical protein
MVVSNASQFFDSGTVQGEVRVQNTPLGFGHRDAVLVSGATVVGNVAITATSFVQVEQDRFAGNVSITDSGQVNVGGNVIQGSLDCQNNTAVTILSPSSVHAGAFGQCADA